MRDMNYTPKLIYCNECTDIVRLWEETAACKCGECSGELTNGGHRAVYRGPAVPIRFGHNFERAVEAHNESCGWGFDAHIPHQFDERFKKETI